MSRRRIQAKERRCGVADLSPSRRAAGIPPDDIRRLEDLEHPASHLALTRIARALGVDVGEIDPGTA
jgi:hypothetical protein